MSKQQVQPFPLFLRTLKVGHAWFAHLGGSRAAEPLLVARQCPSVAPKMACALQTQPLYAQQGNIYLEPSAQDVRRVKRQ